MATVVQPVVCGQSRNARSVGVMVANVRSSLVTWPCSWVMSTHAVTDFLCTSIPQHTAYSTCILHLQSGRTLLVQCAGMPTDQTLFCVLSGNPEATIGGAEAFPI